MICPNCGSEAGANRFCPQCGNALPEAPVRQTVPPSYPTTPQTAPVYASAPVAPQPAAPVYRSSADVRPEDLPPQYRPLSAWAYWGLGLLFTVPIVGFIFLIVFSFSRANINRRSFARSYFCWMLLIAIVLTVFLLAGGSLSFLDSLSQASRY